MNDQLQFFFTDLIHKFFGFLPSLVFGIVILIVGWVLAWFLKRLVIQMSVILKIEGAMTRFQWGKAFSKADVRYGLYNFIGNIVFLIIFLIFVYYALLNWGLTFLSQLLGDGILLFPRLVGSLFIFGAGWLITAGATKALLRVLLQDEVPSAALITHYAKIMLIILFAAMSLVELGIAKQIVIIGFTALYVTLGAVALIFMARYGRGFVQKFPGSSSESVEPSTPDKSRGKTSEHVPE
ncbi:MAG: hypothetical protein ABFD81_09595 [Syntrophaceae bacterium]